MKRKDLNRLKALFLCVIFVLSLIFSAAFIVKEADHDCSGERCEICQLIDLCFEKLNKYIPLVIASAMILTLLRYFENDLVGILNSHILKTPVLLKTRLNN